MDYRLEDIEIDKETHIVAFIDILGFKSHIENFLNDSDKEILNKIKFAFEYALDSPYFKEKDFKIEYKQFSDCTCLSVPSINGDSVESALTLCNLIQLLREFYVIMLLNDVYVRGGLSIGFHYEDDNIIFSEGLIKAYELESKSIYPRIILDDKLIQYFQQFWTTQKYTMSTCGVDKLIVSDWDGTIFINPFKLSESMEKMISEGLMEIPHYVEEKKDLKTSLVETDKKVQKDILKKLELKLIEKDKNVLRKYIWLKELVKWNMDPESSKIKFEYLLK